MFEVRNGVLILNFKFFFLLKTSTINKEPVEQAKRKSLGPVEIHNARCIAKKSNLKKNVSIQQMIKEI